MPQLFQKNMTLVEVYDILRNNLRGGHSATNANVSEANFRKWKGLYFWLMHSDAYNELSRYMKIQPLPAKFVLNGFDLVYVGTAGTRNTGKDDNKSHILDRISWHIIKNRSESCLCNGTMSTFRRTVGSLLSADLIFDGAVSTQLKIDKLFEAYFKIYFIEYGVSYKDVAVKVNTDEEILIDKIRPLFNLKGNKNASINDQVTAKIKERRNIVEDQTKARLNCKRKVGKGIKIPLNLTNVLEVLTSQFGAAYNFKLTQNQNIHEIINSLKHKNHLPAGACKVVLFDPNTRAFIFGKNPHSTGGKGNQNIFRFFNNSQGRKGKKWQIIKEEMHAQNISEITVSVFRTEVL
jgi:hypothetical protein